MTNNFYSNVFTSIFIVYNLLYFKVGYFIDFIHYSDEFKEKATA